MSSERLNNPTRLRGDAKFIGLAVTREIHEFVFDIWSQGNNCAAADIVEGHGRKIVGVVYDVPDHLIRRETSGLRKSLDAIEGNGGNYQRQEIQLNWLADGAPINARVITYIGRDRKLGIKTSPEYTKHILKGLSEHPFPQDYVDYVKSKILENNPDLTVVLTQ